MTTMYVAGLLFDCEAEKVALIHKNRGPASLVGRWNAIGGKQDPGELPILAMYREFLEEAGVYYPNWNLFLLLQGPGWVVSFFEAYSTDALYKVRTMETEEVKIWPLENGRVLLPISEKIPDNLTWIIPMALSHRESNVKFYDVTEI
jgi:8-oxo-dGTP pyrophosphatase MutT (NUDIX family)